MKIDISCKWNKKGARVAVLVPDKIDLSSKAVIRERPLYNDKGVNSSREYNNHKYTCTQHQNTKICYASINRSEGKIENITIIGDFNIPLSTTDRSSRQKISEEALDFNYTIVQMDLMDIYRTLYPTAAKNPKTKKTPKKPPKTFFLRAHGTFSRTDHMLGHKTALNEFKKIKITLSIFCDHNGMRPGKNANKWSLSNLL